MKIRELLCVCNQSRLFDIRPTATSHEVAKALKLRNVGALLVTDDERQMLGIISERDLARAFADDCERFAQRPASELMTVDLECCSEDDDVVDTMARLNAMNIRHIPVVESGRALAMLSIRDFEHACKELSDQAKTDALTGLSNRRAFEDSLKSEFELHNRFVAPMSIAVFDIDHFKSVNDTHGHAVGDQILKALATCVRDAVRSFDIVARIGGEEFSIIFPHTELEDAVNAAERVIRSVELEQFTTDVGSVPVTISGGLSMVQAADLAGSDALRRADQLLYEAKNTGRNRLVIDDMARSHAQVVGAWPASLKVALR